MSATNGTILSPKPCRFKKAKLEQARCHVALYGAAGSGKTKTSLEIATGLGETIAVIDTEHGRSRHYARQYDFDQLELDNYHPHQYIDAIHEAEDMGYETIIIDSLSHAWVGEGGLLELQADIVRKDPRAEFSSWNQHINPIHRRLIETMLKSSCHIIATMRAKTEYVVEKNDKGRNAPRKVGIGPEQRKGMDYEFDVIGYLDDDHTLYIEKDTSDLFHGQSFKLPTAEIGKTLADWFARGERPDWKFTRYHQQVLLRLKQEQKWEKGDTRALLDLLDLSRIEDIPNEETYHQIRQALNLQPIEGLERLERSERNGKAQSSALAAAD